MLRKSTWVNVLRVSDIFPQPPLTFAHTCLQMCRQNEVDSPSSLGWNALKSLWFCFQLWSQAQFGFLLVLTLKADACHPPAQTPSLHIATVSSLPAGCSNHLLSKLHLFTSQEGSGCPSFIYSPFCRMHLSFPGFPETECLSWHLISHAQVATRTCPNPQATSCVQPAFPHSPAAEKSIKW